MVKRLNAAASKVAGQFVKEPDLWQTRPDLVRATLQTPSVVAKTVGQMAAATPSFLDTEISPDDGLQRFRLTSRRREENLELLSDLLEKADQARVDKASKSWVTEPGLGPALA